MTDRNADFPIDGQPLMLAAAKASVPGGHLPDLLRHVQARLGPQFDEYERRYECAFSDDDRAVFLVPSDHWETVGAALGLGDRETDAVRRAHVEQLLRLASRAESRDEFQTALEIRTAVVVGRD
ncbi:hypothetical protein ACNS7O_04535 [Haloferacaceae archaeon DSL9]